MDTKKVVSLGVTAFLCSTIFVAYAINAFGQIKGTFHYVPPDSLIDLFKCVIFAFSGVGAVGLAVSGLVSYRAITEDKSNAQPAVDDKPADPARPSQP